MQAANPLPPYDVRVVLGRGKTCLPRGRQDVLAALFSHAGYIDAGPAAAANDVA